MEDAKIREICNGLRDYESPVDAGLWAGISGVSAAAKTGFSLSMFGKIAAGVAIAGGISAGVYLSLRDSAIEKTPSPLVEEVSKESPSSADEGGTGSTEENDGIESNSESAAADASRDLSEANGDKTITAAFEKEKDSDLQSELEDETVPFGTEEIPVDTEKDGMETNRISDSPENSANPSFEVELLRHQDKEDPLLWMFSARGHEAAAYAWDFGDGTSMEGRRVTHRFRQSGSFEVCARAEMPGGMETVKCTQIEARYDVKVVLPNIFSPGSSPGVNDFYDLNMEASQHVISYILRVFTQDGHLVFESREGQQAWDGNDRFGEPMPVGVYLVVAEVKGPGGELVVERQTLTLNR